MPRLICLAILLSLPAVAPAQEAGDLWVTNTEICPGLREGADLAEAMGEAEALVLAPGEILGIEYRCRFEPPLDLTAPDHSISVHTGFCEEPGLLTPQLFAFRIERQENPRVTLHDGQSEPLAFFACPR